MEPVLEIGLFAVTPEGMSLLGHSRDPELVEAVRKRIASDKQTALSRLAHSSGTTLVDHGEKPTSSKGHNARKRPE